MHRRRFIAASAVALSAAAAPLPLASAAHAGRRLPTRYVVSDKPGVLPEGIGITPDGTIYVTGSGNGDLYRGHVTRDRLHPFASGGSERPFAAGVHPDRRGWIFVAARATLDVHGRDGRLLARRTGSSGPVGETFLNDLVVTRDAVYVTDSTNAVLWRAALRGHRLGSLERWLDLRSLVPGMPAQYFFLNGIDATPDGRALIVASQGLESLIRVDVTTRTASLIDLGGTSFGPDGLVLRGNHVYAVLNYAAPDGQGVYVARLNDDLTTGKIIAGVVDPAFDSPTTLALHDRRVYVVNSQFDHAPGTPPYTVVTVPDPLR
ncbi:SMP-30/gluconolactonase/LRE family protein [Plantactinospora sp. GCM10030261]|uniref:SMP-30/gluconolactonase/LRE family protein n=1 Tax=Plantactinospora sp. GCM10030261 TaxID=3273420 RepID=UPI00360D1694